MATHISETYNRIWLDPFNYIMIKFYIIAEYADDLSKSDFLQEISLMKNLGYNEKLVNMIACITMSEPYCLVVEYCSNGDLLHYLRDKRDTFFKVNLILNN